jgi:hypothetical protein
MTGSMTTVTYHMTKTAGNIETESTKEVEKMNDIAFTKELLLMLAPLIALQLGMAIYCAVKIFTEGVENLNKWIWLGICLFVNLLGPIIFLIVGRKKVSS